LIVEINDLCKISPIIIVVIALSILIILVLVAIGFYFLLQKVESERAKRELYKGDIKDNKKSTIV
jgi:hypothetical protein